MAAEQDRRSNMVNSSVNGQPAKGGAGGSYTWGSALDVQDYAPMGVGAGYGVVMAPQPQMVQTVAAPAFQMDQQAFPVLGAPPTMVTQGPWGPPAVNTGPISEGALRSGAYIGGQQHPRNVFAKKPYMQVRQANGQMVVQAQEGVIDCNQSGMAPAVMQSIVQSNAAAAHLGPYAQAAPVQIPLSALQAQTAFSSQQIYQGATPTNAQNFAPRPVQAAASRKNCC